VQTLGSLVCGVRRGGVNWGLLVLIWVCFVFVYFCLYVIVIVVWFVIVIVAMYEPHGVPM
jgi:hypothetical protein